MGVPSVKLSRIESRTTGFESEERLEVPRWHPAAPYNNPAGNSDPAARMQFYGTVLERRRHYHPVALICIFTRIASPYHT